MSVTLRRSLGWVGWLAAVLLSGCGGGGGGGSSGGGPAVPTATNVQAVSVEQGPANVVNGLYVTVTVCVPNTDTCQAIDHIMVDTGSNGLRIMASVLHMNLPLERNGSGKAIAECAQFADGHTWGPLRIADVRLSGEQAASVPIQVIGDTAYPTVPDDCTGTGPDESSVASFGGNGVLGVGVFKQDCGAGCAIDPANTFYYLCPCGAGSASDIVALNLQVQNPVALFANDNNGVIIQLQPVGDSGAAKLGGSMIFGIGTQPNNALGTARVFTVDSSSGMFSTVYNGQEYRQSLLDTGSTVTFFNDSGITICPPGDATAPGFYCPNGTQSLHATVRGRNLASTTLDFKVANAHDLFADNPDFWAFDDIAAPSVLPDSFVWGLPVFMGRKVYTVIEGQNVPGAGSNPDAGVGPYVAF